MTTDLIEILFLLSGCKGFRNLIINYENRVTVEYEDPAMNQVFETIEEFIEWLENL